MNTTEKLWKYLKVQASKNIVTNFSITKAEDILDASPRQIYRSFGTLEKHGYIKINRDLLKRRDFSFIKLLKEK